MNILSNIGISSGSKVEAWHVTQSIDAFTGEQEYDIFLSGSLTITGSLIFDQITNNISGNSSYALTSSYTPNSDTSDHALIAYDALNQTTILTFTHPQINLTGSTTYYIGNGNITTTGSFSPGYTGITPAGIMCPVKGTIVSASITTNSVTSGSIVFTSKISLSVNLSSGVSLGTFYYKPNVYNITKDVGIYVNPGDRLTFEIATQPSSPGQRPQLTTHNIQLYIQS